MTPILMPRLATNIETYADCDLVGSIANDMLTVTAVSWGTILPGAPLYGALSGSYVVHQCTGPTGGVGVYCVSPAQVLASGPLYAGTKQAMQKMEFVTQIDVHGPNSMTNVTSITTLFRDEYGCQFFTDNASFDAQPLYTSDPRQVAFVNAEEQYEDRWTVDLTMQVNSVVQTGLQFFDDPIVTVTSVGTLPLV
jgi:hypothetical protein